MGLGWVGGWLLRRRSDRSQPLERNETTRHAIICIWKRRRRRRCMRQWRMGWKGSWSSLSLSLFFLLPSLCTPRLCIKHTHTHTHTHRQYWTRVGRDRVLGGISPLFTAANGAPCTNTTSTLPPFSSFSTLTQTLVCLPFLDGWQS